MKGFERNLKAMVQYAINLHENHVLKMQLPHHSLILTMKRDCTPNKAGTDFFIFSLGRTMQIL